MNGTDARGGNRTTSDLEAPEAARGIGAGRQPTRYLDPHTRWQRQSYGEVFDSGSEMSALYEMRRAIDKQIFDNVTLSANPPPRYVRHPLQPNVWLPTEEHPDADLTPAQLYDVARKHHDMRRILLEAGAYPGMLCTSAMRDAVAAVVRAESIDGHIYGAFYASAQRRQAMDALRELITATKVPVAAERLSQALGIPLDAPTKPLPAMARVIVGKDGKMETVAAPPAIDIERVRRETRDHITGNGAPWFTDPNAEAKPIGTTTWCGVCNRNVTGEPCVTVYAGSVNGCFTASGA